MTIALVHKHFDKAHLEEIKELMKTLGAPIIRCIWSECHGLWLAVEGCHRIRAAKEMGLTPIIKDISNNKTVKFQWDGELITKSVSKLGEQLNDNAPYTTIMDFEEEDYA